MSIFLFNQFSVPCLALLFSSTYLLWPSAIALLYLFTVSCLLLLPFFILCFMVTGTCHDGKSVKEST
ncbi:hypothetical protein BGW37DRAFT_509584 [Umbelopsis sp. PMI_123]|nr:hypothetical protein BGW37DRAFT_509584 [Umbelopsis sp. PMI_123]